VGAELGVPGLASILLFYGACLVGVFPLCLRNSEVPDPWHRDAARMVVSAIVGFAIAAQFVSMEFLEIPYYIAIVGAGLLKLKVKPVPVTVPRPVIAPTPMVSGYARVAP
jgi:hypothetical protein